MPVLRIPTPLRVDTNGQATVNVTGNNVSEVLIDLTNQYPTIKPHIFNEDGVLRPFVNLFVGDPGRNDYNISFFDGERNTIWSSKLNAAGSLQNGKDFMGGTVIVMVVVNAIHPRTCPAVGFKNFFYGLAV